MYDVGILGIDSVHADTLATVLWKYHDARVAAVWTESDDADSEALEEFCNRYDAQSFDRPARMVDAVDAAMVTATWDRHAALAVEFLNAVVPTLVDKPMVGRLADLENIVEASRRGDAVLFGGSAVPYHHDFDRFSTNASEQTVHCVCYRDEFFYGSHVVDTLRRLVGNQWEAVEPAPSPGKSVGIRFADQSYATVRFDGPLADAGFGFLNVGNRVDTTVVRSFSTSQPNMDPVEREETYRSYLDRFFGNVAGEYADAEWIVDAAHLLLAALAALEHDDTITRDDDRTRDVDVQRSDVPAKFVPDT